MPRPRSCHTQQARADLPQDEVHDQSDTADADDADVDDLEAEVGRSVLGSSRPRPRWAAISSDQPALPRRPPGQPAAPSEYAGTVSGMDDFPEDLELAGAERLRDADKQRRDLRTPSYITITPAKKRGIKKDQELGDLVDPKQTMTSGSAHRRQCTKEILIIRVGKGARRRYHRAGSRRNATRIPSATPRKHPPRSDA